MQDLFPQSRVRVHVAPTRPLTHHAALLSLALAGACAGPATNLVLSPGQSVEIRASYYSRALVGRKTASGEPYDPALFTAAHATMPMGTILRVTRPPDGPSVEVRVNDRCGGAHGRGRAGGGAPAEPAAGGNCPGPHRGSGPSTDSVSAQRRAAVWMKSHAAAASCPVPCPTMFYITA